MKMIRLLSSAHNYERDAPNMSRAISLKCGGYVYAFSEYVPFTLFIKEL